LSDGLVSLFGFYGKSSCTDSQVQEVLVQVQSLLKANPGFKNLNSDTKFFIWTCQYLDGKLGVAILSLLLTEYTNGVGAGLSLPDAYRRLPIHVAAQNSTLDVIKLLLKAYPESRYKTNSHGSNLLHHVSQDPRKDRALVNSKVQYLCDHYPDLLRKSSNRGLNPLMYYAGARDFEFDLKTIVIMCEVDSTIIAEKCQDPENPRRFNKKLLLHFLVQGRTFTSGVTVEADCFRYLLNLFPAAAGIKDGRGLSPHNIAIANNMNVYFIRLHLKYAAHKEAMLLAYYGALSNNQDPSTWNKLRAPSASSIADVRYIISMIL
jgi:ankyrin repeat protein